MPYKNLIKEKMSQVENKLVLINKLKQYGSLPCPINRLCNLMPVPFVFKDCDGVYQLCNDIFAKNILGVNKENVIGKSMIDFPASIPHPRANTCHHNDLMLLKRGGQDSYETVVQCADGVERYYLLYKSILELDSKKVGMAVIMLDISRYKNTLTELDKLHSTLETFNLYKLRRLAS